ncbi:MAG: signal peptide peptidase SppA [Acidobacteria bacterium]|nr:signal peptide peptidase SppA [Acidobacteriota bacterium]
MLARKRFFLRIEMKEVITETVPEYSLLSRKRKTHLKILLDAIERASRDKKIAAILLVVRQPEMGWAQVEELVTALDDFRRHNKSVMIFLENAGNKEYFLASAAEFIFLAPSGAINLVGLRSESVFFKNILQWLGIHPELVHIGKYKSSADIFTRESMSEAHREQMEALIQDLQRQLIERIGSCRRRSQEEVTGWINKGPYSAFEAKEAGIVDDLLFEDLAIKKLEDQKLVRRDLERYKVGDGFWKRLFTYRRPQVALVAAEGLIAGGRSRRTGGRRMICGSETIGDFLADARKRKRIRGVVLRISSPGGSSLASDTIWREVQLTAEKKPVVVSMGDVAASGGYYIATAAKKILSRRATITGSIGVISGKFVIRDLLEKLKIQTDSISGADHAGFSSVLQSFSAEEHATLRRHLEEFYRVHFVPKVAQSRSQSEEQVLRLAQGRIWSGERAHRCGLVDGIGGIREAVEEVRSLCHYPPRRPLRVVMYAKKPSLRELLVSGLGSATWLDTVTDLIRIFQEEVLALLPFEIRIR